MRVLRWAALAALVGAAPPQASDELVVRGDDPVASGVNGVPIRLRVDPAAAAMPGVTAGLARRAGLKAGPFDVSYTIGPVVIEGRTALGRIDLGRGPEKRRIAWFDRPWGSREEAVVGPGGVPAPVVRFQLRSPRPRERAAALRMVGQGGLEDRWAGLYALVDVGGEPVRVRFDPRSVTTTATAAAGVRLARAHDGVLEGPALRTEIAFGVERPVRTLRLARPLPLGPLRIDRLLVRVSDHGDASGLPDAREPRDPDEVVVTARSGRDRRYDRIVLGRDQLDRCSSITFDKRRREIRLSCL